MHRIRKCTGITWTRIAVVAAVLAISTSTAISTQMPNGLAFNEAQAISTLRSIASAQAQFHAAAEIDTNCDRVGEYGYFAELAGTVAMRVGVFSSWECVPNA